MGLTGDCMLLPWPVQNTYLGRKKWVFLRQNPKGGDIMNGPQGAHTMLITSFAHVGRGRLASGYYMGPHTGTRWHNICHLPNRIQALHRLTWFYHLACHLHGIPSATTLVPSAICTVLVSIIFSTHLMKPCLTWWKFVCNWKYFCTTDLLRTLFFL